MSQLRYLPRYLGTYLNLGKVLSNLRRITPPGETARISARPEPLYYLPGPVNGPIKPGFGCFRSLKARAARFPEENRKKSSYRLQAQTSLSKGISAASPLSSRVGPREQSKSNWFT